MKKGVFLDRDGVINTNVLNEVTGESESPHYPKDFKLFPWAIESLRKLQESKFLLFLISNQPSYAKGKASLENIKEIHKKFHSVLLDNQVYFTEYFYCYHHPQGIVPKLSINCSCRKPGTLFFEEARRKYSLDMRLCWMIGDSDSDIACGAKACVKMILISNQDVLKTKRSGKSPPNFIVSNLWEAANIIVKKM